jgi:hypothetical protein
MQQKVKEKLTLEQELRTLRETKARVQSECDEALRTSSITSEFLHEYIRSRECLEEYGLSIDREGDLLKLINVINNLKHSGYDAKSIIKNYQTSTACKLEKKNYKIKSKR